MEMRYPPSEIECAASGTCVIEVAVLQLNVGGQLKHFRILNWNSHIKLRNMRNQLCKACSNHEKSESNSLKVTRLLAAHT